MTEIIKSQVTKLRIIGLPSLDPVDVYFEDLRDGWGKTTITCFGDSWSYTWGAMGSGRKMEQFFLSCDEHYLSNKFYCGSQWVTDWDGIPNALRKEAVRRRKENSLDADDARFLYDLANEVEEHSNEEDWIMRHSPSRFHSIWPDFCHDVPQKRHHNYEYLQRIIIAVQCALRNQLAEVTK